MIPPSPRCIARDGVCMVSDSVTIPVCQNVPPYPRWICDECFYSPKLSEVVRLVVRQHNLVTPGLDLHQLCDDIRTALPGATVAVEDYLEKNQFQLEVFGAQGDRVYSQRHLVNYPSQYFPHGWSGEAPVVVTPPKVEWTQAGRGGGLVSGDEWITKAPLLRVNDVIEYDRVIYHVDEITSGPNKTLILQTRICNEHRIPDEEFTLTIYKSDMISLVARDATPKPKVVVVKKTQMSMFGDD